MNLLALRGVSKDFGGVPVLRGVDLEGEAGQVLGVVGANGAGKSTLIKILSGALSMSSGEMWMDGERVSLRSPHDAHDKGIRTVFQELSLVPELSVTENLLMGNLTGHGRRAAVAGGDARTSLWERVGLIDWSAAHTRAQELLDRVGFGAIDPRAKASQLSVARRQMVEIAKALVSQPRVLVLDEPSAVLAGSDLDALFALVRRLREQGVLVIYVSHRLVEVLDLATSIVVIKDGQVIETTQPSDTNSDELIRLMAGRRLEQIYPDRRTGRGDPLLTVTGLTRPGEFNDISFQLHAGEVVGLFGLVGSGRSELAECVFGARTAAAGEVRMAEGSGDFRTPGAAIAAGLALVTEDRAGSGLVMGMNVLDNISLTTWRSHTRGPLIDTARQRSDVATMVRRLDIRPPQCASMRVVNLSGGNQQKVVLAKWLSAGPRVLILDEPTRGVDMATRVDIYRMVDQLAREGLAVLLISSDLTEVIGASDRLLVMSEGRLTGELDSARTTEDEVLTYSMGTSR